MALWRYIFVFITRTHLGQSRALDVHANPHSHVCVCDSCAIMYIERVKASGLPLKLAAIPREAGDWHMGWSGCMTLVGCASSISYGRTPMWPDKSWDVTYAKLQWLQDDLVYI